MANLPAFCDNCGTVFNSGIAGSGSSMITISNCKAGPCPVCGSMGTVPDGAFNLQEHLVTVLSGPASTHERFMRLKAVLEQAKAANKSAEETIKSVEAVDPTIGKLARFFTVDRVLNGLAVLVAIVDLAVRLQSPAPLSREDARILIQEAIQATRVHEAPDKEVKQNEGGSSDRVDEIVDGDHDPKQDPENDRGFIST
ncbi:hypothetical protein [Orrella marina]|nr:hypothetical protein [Orrella marina]